MTDTILLPKGASKGFTGTWPDGNIPSGGADLSGYDISIYDEHDSLTGFTTISFILDTAGTFNGVISWNSKIPTGRVASFRIKLTPKPAFPALLPDVSLPIFVEVV